MTGFTLREMPLFRLAIAIVWGSISIALMLSLPSAPLDWQYRIHCAMWGSALLAAYNLVRFGLDRSLASRRRQRDWLQRAHEKKGKVVHPEFQIDDDSPSGGSPDGNRH